MLDVVLDPPISAALGLLCLTTILYFALWLDRIPPRPRQRYR